MDQLGTPELLLILVIVILLFGIGRIGKVGSELGQGLRAFREGLHGQEEVKPALEVKEDPLLPKLPPPAEKQQTYYK